MRDSAAIFMVIAIEGGENLRDVMTIGVGRINQDDSIVAQGYSQNRHHQNSWHATK
jgi:hypothetical protein